MDLDSAPNISIINGFTAMLGDRFEVLTVGSRSGDFSTVNGLEVGGGGPISEGLTVQPN